jgi:hypothetical protein
MSVIINGAASRYTVTTPQRRVTAPHVAASHVVTAKSQFAGLGRLIKIAEIQKAAERAHDTITITMVQAALSYSKRRDMKRLLAGSIATAALMVAAMAGTAQAAGTPVTKPAPANKTKVAPQAWQAHGTIRPVGNGHYCLTWLHPQHDGDAVFVLPCVTGDAQQQWYMYRTAGVGQINTLAVPSYVIGQNGRTDRNVRLFDYDTDMTKGPVMFVHFNLYENGWLINIFIGKSPLFATVPSHLQAGKTYIPTWSAGSSSNKKTQEWLTPKWTLIQD